MKYNLEQFYKKVFSKKRTLLVLAVIIYIFAFFSVTGLKWQENILNLLPELDSEISEYKEILNNFDPLTAMFIDVGLEDGPVNSEEQLMEVADSLYQTMADSGWFSMITYKWDYDELLSILNVLRVYRPVLFNELDEEIVKRKTSASAIESSFDDWVRTLAESPAPFLSKQFLSDPLNLSELDLNRLNTLQSASGSVQVHSGRLFTRDLNHLLIIAYPTFFSTDSRRSVELIRFMDESILKAKESVSLPEISVAYISGHRFSVENAQRIKRDVRLTISISLLAIAILTILIYSRPQLMLLTLLPAVFGTTLALGAMRWFVPNVSGIIIGSGAMLIGIAVDYGIHLLFHVDQAGEREPVSRIISQLTRPLLLGAATTLVAFLTLQVSILPGYRQLGKFVAIGIGSSLVFVLFILPLLLKNRGKIRARKPVLPIALFYPHFYRFILKKRFLVLLLLTCFSLAAFFGLFKLRFEGDVQKLNAVSREIKLDMDQVLGSFGDALSSTSAAVKGPTLEEALQKNEILAGRLNLLQKEGSLESFTSAANILPSRLKQNLNAERWRNYFSVDKIEEIRQSIWEASSKRGIRPELFDEFIRELSRVPAFLEMENIKGSLLDDLLHNQISVSDQGAIILSNITLSTPDQFDPLKNQLKSLLPDVILYNGIHFVSKMVFLIFKELKRMGGIAIVLIVFLLFLFKRNFRIVLTILAPLVLSLTWTFGIMGWFGLKINIINCVVSVFIFGLVVDYCVFLVSSFDPLIAQRENHLLRTSGAVTISALTTMLGLGALVLAKHPALRSLGLTALLGIGSGLVAALLIVPLFYRRLNPFHSGK